VAVLLDIGKSKQIYTSYKTILINGAENISLKFLKLEFVISVSTCIVLFISSRI
jgi:hypothetical protein